MNIINENEVLFLVPIRYFFPDELVNFGWAGVGVTVDNKSCVGCLKVADLFDKSGFSSLRANQKDGYVIFDHLDNHGVELGVFDSGHPE